MKKLLFLLAFISTSAFAIDRPIPCTGNSCKLLFETTGSGGAKVSAGNVDGLGTWTLGPSSVVTRHRTWGSMAFSDTASSAYNLGIVTEVGGALLRFGGNEESAANRFGGTYTQASGGGMIGIDTRPAATELISVYGRVPASATLNLIASSTSAGSWTLGPPTFTNITHNFRGNISLINAGADKGLGLNSYIDATRDFVRSDTTKGGGAITFNPNVSGGNTISFVVNQAGDGATTAGDYAANITDKGEFKVGLLSAGLFSVNGIAHYRLNTIGGGGESCTTACAVEPAALNASSGACVIAWTSSGVLSACGTTLVSGVCMCVGLY